MADPRKGFFVSRNRMRVWWPSHSELQRWNAEQGKRWRRHIHSELTPSPQTSLLLPGKETEVQRAEATCGKSHSGRAWTTAWAPPAPGLRLLTRAPHHEALHWPLTRPSALRGQDCQSISNDALPTGTSHALGTCPVVSGADPVPLTLRWELLETEPAQQWAPETLSLLRLSLVLTQSPCNFPGDTVLQGRERRGGDSPAQKAGDPRRHDSLP